MSEQSVRYVYPVNSSSDEDSECPSGSAAIYMLVVVVIGCIATIAHAVLVYPITVDVFGLIDTGFVRLVTSLIAGAIAAILSLVVFTYIMWKR